MVLTLFVHFYIGYLECQFLIAYAHSMTTLATGGFSTHNKSIGFFSNSNIEIVASIFIILGSIPFITYLKFLKGNRKISYKIFKLKV